MCKARAPSHVTLATHYGQKFVLGFFLNDFPFTILSMQEFGLVHFLFVCFQAVDFLVKKTYVSGAESTDIGPRDAQSSTVPPSNPSPTCQQDHLIGKSCKRKYEEPFGHGDFWVKIQAPNFIIQCITEGYKIPFYETPPRAHKEFVTKSIQELLAYCPNYRG